MKANIRNASIIALLAMMAASMVACFSDSSAGGGSDWDEARVSALETQVADLEAENAHLAERLDELAEAVAQAVPRTRLQVSRISDAGLKSDDAALTVGEVVHHLPQQTLRESSVYEVTSTEGYLFELPATSAEEEVAITAFGGQLLYDQANCQGAEYIGQADIGSAGVAQGYVLRHGDGWDPASYRYVAAGEPQQTVTIESWREGGSCNHPVEPAAETVYPLLPNDEAVTGVPSEPLMGPTIMGPGSGN